MIFHWLFCIKYQLDVPLVEHAWRCLNLNKEEPISVH